MKFLYFVMRNKSNSEKYLKKCIHSSLTCDNPSTKGYIQENLIRKDMPSFMPWVTKMRHILYFIAAYQTYWTNCLFVVSEQVSATKSILSAKNWISTQFSGNCAFFVEHICSCFWLRIVIVLFTSRWISFCFMSNLLFHDWTKNRGYNNSKRPIPSVQKTD